MLKQEPILCRQILPFPPRPVIMMDMSQTEHVWAFLTQLNAEQIQQLARDHVGLALLVCFASGILTSFTPCVYPMIPITINIFGRLSQKNQTRKRKGFDPHTFFLASIYVAGMCATYSAMGLFAGLTGSLFGKILQSSFVLGFLTLLFVALAVSQLGFFKLALPGSLQTRLSRLGDAESGFGIFIMGSISGLIVSPCVGPVIAGILAFVFDTSDAFRGFLYFFSFSLGLGLLFLLIGGFSGILVSLPKSGTWMTRVNRILAILMLIAAGYYGILFLKNIGLIKSKIGVDASVTGVRWISDESTALKLAKEKNLPILVDFTAEWCEACHVLDRTVLSHPTVVDRLKNFILLRIDVTEENEINDATRRVYSVLGLPAILFTTPEGKPLEKPRVNGVLPFDEFLKMLDVAQGKK